MVSGRPLPLALKNRVLGLMAGSHRENVSEKQFFFSFFLFWLPVYVGGVCVHLCMFSYMLVHASVYVLRVGVCTCVCSPLCWCTYVCMFSCMLVHARVYVLCVGVRIVYVLLGVGAYMCVCSPGHWCVHVCMFSACWCVHVCGWQRLGLGSFLYYSPLCLLRQSLSLSDLAHQFASFD